MGLTTRCAGFRDRVEETTLRAFVFCPIQGLEAGAMMENKGDNASTCFNILE